MLPDPHVIEEGGEIEEVAEHVEDEAGIEVQAVELRMVAREQRGQPPGLARSASRRATAYVRETFAARTNRLTTWYGSGFSPEKWKMERYQAQAKGR